MSASASVASMSMSSHGTAADRRMERSLQSVSGSGSGGAGGVDIASTTNGYGFRSTAGDALSIEVAFLNPRRRFPLADEFLPRVRITDAEAQELKGVCETMIANALTKTSMFAWDGNNNHIIGASKHWKQHYNKQNLTLYRKRKEQAGDSALRHFVARGQVHSMNLQDVEYGMYCDTTVDERAVMTDLYRDMFLDAAVLKVFESQSEEDPFHFFGIKWLAHVSPADKFVSPRDYAFVEYSKRVVNKMGEPFLVKVTHSITTDNVPAMSQREFDLIRGVISCTYIYRYDAPTKNVQVFADGYIDPSGSAPGWLSKSFLTKFAPTIVNLEHSADVKYIMRNHLVLTFDALQERIAGLAKQKKHCVSCLKSFGLINRNYTRCRACAQTVCTRCIMALTLCIPTHEKRCAEHPSAVVQEKFCFKCLYTGRLDRNGKYLLEPLESRSQYSGSSAGGDRDEDYLASKITQVTMTESDDEGWSTDDGGGSVNNNVTSEQDRVRRLRLRHLEREKRKNMEQRRAPAVAFARTLYHGPDQSRRAGGNNGYNSTMLAREQTDATAFADMERSIAEQEALIRSIQSERAKLAQMPSRSQYLQHHSQYQHHRTRESPANWRGGESRFTEYESSDDDSFDTPSAHKMASVHKQQPQPASSFSHSTRTTMSSTSDSVGSYSDYP